MQFGGDCSLAALQIQSSAVGLYHHKLLRLSVPYLALAALLANLALASDPC